MTSLPKADECLTPNLGKLEIVRDDLDRRVTNQVVKLLPCRLIMQTAGEDHRSFLQAHRRQTDWLLGNSAPENIGFRLSEQYGDQGGRIDRNHAGKPFSS